jgi:Mn-dependent DtxR family transcriptional regulator
MTQDLIAGMLGVRREGITEAAGKLQAAGFIRYRRGHISIVDRGGLASRACECLVVIRAELARMDLHPGAVPTTACVPLAART